MLPQLLELAAADVLLFLLLLDSWEVVERQSEDAQETDFRVQVRFGLILRESKAFQQKYCDLEIPIFS